MRRLSLVTDCAACAGVCCIATSFEANDDFAHTKPSNERCEYLTPNHRCSIHGERERRGYGGCAVYDCHGAGPRVTSALPGAENVEQRSAAFLVVRELHELLSLLDHAEHLMRSDYPAMATRLSAQFSEVDALVDAAMSAPGAVEIDRLAPQIHALLREVGAELGDAGRARRRLRLLQQRE